MHIRAVTDLSGSSQTSVADRTFRIIIYDGLASEAMGSLTTGVFLAGFAVELGASNFAIGVLAAMPFLVQLLQLPAAVLIERWRDRRAICVLASGFGRCFLLACAATPFLHGPQAMTALILLLSIHQGMAAVGGCSWSSWMRDLVPGSEYGRFFGKRSAATTAVSTVLAFLGSIAVDHAEKHLVPTHPAFAYSLLFIASGLIGLCGVRVLARAPNQPMAPVDRPTHPLAMISAPFQDLNFRRLIMFLSSWNFAANLAAPFFTVYMLKSLQYPLRVVMLLTIASQISNLVSLNAWGALIDRFSNRAVLEVAAPLYLVCILGWTATGLSWTQSFTFALLFGIHMLMGVATAGIALASNNVAMKLSPRGQATAYLATNSVVTSAFGALAPIIGGVCADFFASHQLTFAFTWAGGPKALTVDVINLHAWTFFFGLAFVAGLYSLYRLSFVEERGGGSDPRLLRHFILEAGRSLHSLSSAAGLLRIGRSPIVLSRERAD